MFPSLMEYPPSHFNSFLILLLAEVRLTLEALVGRFSAKHGLLRAPFFALRRIVSSCVFLSSTPDLIRDIVTPSLCESGSECLYVFGARTISPGPPSVSLEDLRDIFVSL